MVYRVFHRRYDPLDGHGAAMVGGRWNPVGRPVVYASATYEGALLEQLVHANTGVLPPNRVAASIEVPDDSVEYVDPSRLDDWEDQAVSREFGKVWLESRSSVALIVPSVVSKPWGRNVVLNPSHPDFGAVGVERRIDVTWDRRLLRTDPKGVS